MSHRDRETYNAYMNEYMKARYKKRRQAAITQLGGKCVECGSYDDLVIHHKNPEDRQHTTSELSSVNEAYWQEELKLCVLLCATCHRNAHRSKAPCGTPQRYWRGCRCDACRKANNAHGKEYKKRWRAEKKAEEEARKFLAWRKKKEQENTQ